MLLQLIALFVGPAGIIGFSLPLRSRQAQNGRRLFRGFGLTHPRRTPMPEPLEERRDESAAELIDRIEQHSQEIASAQFERPAAGRWRIIVLAVGIVSSSAS